MRNRVLCGVLAVVALVAAAIPGLADGPVAMQVLQPQPAFPLTGTTLPIAVTYTNPLDAQAIYFDSYIDGQPLLAKSINYPPFMAPGTRSFHFRQDADLSKLGLKPGSHTLVFVLRDSLQRLSRTEMTITVQLPQARELKPPTVRIISPVDGQNITGPCNIKVDASDESGINFVTVLINGEVYGVTNEPPYTIAWDPMKLAKGEYTLVATALDAWDNRSTSAPVLVRLLGPNDPTRLGDLALGGDPLPTNGGEASAVQFPLSAASPFGRFTYMASLPSTLTPAGAQASLLPWRVNQSYALAPSKAVPGSAEATALSLSGLGEATTPEAPAGEGPTVQPWAMGAGVAVARTQVYLPETGPTPARSVQENHPAVRMALVPPSRSLVPASGMSETAATLERMPTVNAAGLAPDYRTTGWQAPTIAELPISPRETPMVAAMISDRAARGEFLGAPTLVARIPMPLRSGPDQAIMVAPIYDVPTPLLGGAATLPQPARVETTPVLAGPDAPHTASAAATPQMPAGIGAPLGTTGAPQADGASLSMPAVKSTPALDTELGTPSIEAAPRLQGQLAPALGTDSVRLAMAPDYASAWRPAPQVVTPVADTATRAIVAMRPSTEDSVLIAKAAPTASRATGGASGPLWAALPATPRVVASTPTAVLAASAEPSTASEPVEVMMDPVAVYRPRQGETLDKVAKALATTPDALQKLNPGISAGRLEAGTAIVVPVMGDAKLTLDSRPLTGDGEVYPEPYIINGYSMVPLRLLTEAKGGVVVWVPQTQEVNAWVKSTFIGVKIGDRHARINDANVVMPLPAAMKDNRAMVPLRFMMQALNLDVDYNPTSGTYALISKSAR